MMTGSSVGADVADDAKQDEHWGSELELCGTQLMITGSSLWDGARRGELWESDEEYIEDCNKERRSGGYQHHKKSLQLPGIL